MQLWSIFFSACLLGNSLAGPISNARSSRRRETTSTSTGGDILTVLNNVANDQTENTSEKAANILTRIRENSNANNAESIEATFNAISDIFSDGSKDIAQASDELIAKGLVPSDIFDFLNGYADFSLNSLDNTNSRSPNSTIYPSKSSEDAPYSLDEDTLRGAIYIPSSFSYGANGKRPIILVPGTAVPAGTTYHFSFSKVDEAADVDPVWVNIPSASLGDAQVNSEYVAYAINYISGVSSSNVAVLSWSQGGLDTQWALKYWPSTRDAVDDFIAVSPDFHGTIEQAFLCPGFPSYPCTPSIWQQGLDSNFIKTIRDDDGDSAYVPTITLYSTYDEVVQPMSGPSASALLSDTRGVGVTNNHVQIICPNQPAGGVYTHEGMLYNPLTWALAVDAINHDGPGDPSRLNLEDICSQSIPPQLQLDDVFGTEGLLLVAVAEILGYGNRATSEPAIAAYAG
ncbi:lipase, putative [Paecilomyces variotii No. 5]|uniref:Lipase, putative n=1 Tax=Byssochlamys spectabilis (strain No. 5 / NBRC 109023) TaxID=1356009 RepID=V5FVI3_BYSSN|nr:lipase, putative [Paecilomyces variotii No. 5]